ncbi:MAG: hypothetical protein NXI22_17095 [bacterium]|nr:hypothetical protein [bacterium]
MKRLVALYHSIEDDIEDEAAFLKAAGLEKGDAAMVAVASVLLNLDETLMKP